MTPQQKKRISYFLGKYGEALVRSWFKLPLPGKRSFDLRIPTLENQTKGVRLEVKSRRLRLDGSFIINFTRFERTHADYFMVLVFSPELQVERTYMIPNYRLGYSKGYAYFPKGKCKWDKWRII